MQSQQIYTCKTTENFFFNFYLIIGVEIKIKK